MTIKKRVWIPLACILLLCLLFAAAWVYVPDYAERRFTEKLLQLGIETDSVEFRIEGFSRPVVRDLSLRISGVNLVAESVEFGSLWDGYGDGKPLKVKVNGLWAGVNAQIPEGLLGVNNAILALPEKESFQSPLPLEISFGDGVVLYENHGRQIEGMVGGTITVENTNLEWELDIDVREHPVRARGAFDWATGTIDIAGEMSLSHQLGLAIWDILNQEPMFDWDAGNFQAAFQFEGENYRYQSGQVHAMLNGVAVGFEGLAVDSSNHVASILWTPGVATVDFAGDGNLAEFIDAPFSWQGTLSIEAGPTLQFSLSEASITPDLKFGVIHMEQPASNHTPLEVSILGGNEGFDFQMLGLDLHLGSETGDQLGSSTLDLMVNGRWQNHLLVNTSADLWLRDGLFISPMFQMELGESLLNAELPGPIPANNLVSSLLNDPTGYVQSASLSDVTLFRYAEVIGKGMSITWTPGEPTSILAQGDFYGIGGAELAVEPNEDSTFRDSRGIVRMNPGDFSMEYLWEFDLFKGLSARLELEEYPIQAYPDLKRWLTGEFDITGTLSAEARIEVTPEKARPHLKFALNDVLYASGDLVLDNANYEGVIDSLFPFRLESSKPFTVSAVQIRGWSGSDLQTDFEIENRINITNTSLSVFGGTLKFSDISMSKEDLFIESEIGVSDIQTEEVLQWIPKVIGMAEGTISGVIPFQWDVKNGRFSLGRGHLRSPEGELGYMNLKIFRPEGDQGDDLLQDDRYSMVDEALSNLQDSSLDIDILPPNELTTDTRVRLNIKGFVDSRLVKAPVDVVRYYSLPIESLSLTMEEVRQDLPGIRSATD